MCTDKAPLSAAIMIRRIQRELGTSHEAAETGDLPSYDSVVVVSNAAAKVEANKKTQLERALKRWKDIGEAAFKCEACSKPIGEERLELQPGATRCFDCETALSAGGSRRKPGGGQ